jgi:hypothetical protein
VKLVNVISSPSRATAEQNILMACKFRLSWKRQQAEASAEELPKTQRDKECLACADELCMQWMDGCLDCHLLMPSQLKPLLELETRAKTIASKQSDEPIAFPRHLDHERS